MKDVTVRVLDEQEMEYVKILRAEGFTMGEAKVLVALMVNGNVGQKELSVIIDRPQSNVSVALSKLAAKNYVNLINDVRDGCYYKRVELLIDPIEALSKLRMEESAAALEKMRVAKTFQSGGAENVL
jgi:DNA-binding MarR family transcriptional regulator